VMSLRDGTKKMSKSDTSDYSRINLADDADAIALKIRKARTDPNPVPASDAEAEGRPEAANLVNIYAALAGLSREAVYDAFGGRLFSDFKTVLADLAVSVLGPISQEMRRLTAEPAFIDGILRRGAERAAGIARPHLSDVHRIMGLLRP